MKRSAISVAAALLLAASTLSACTEGDDSRVPQTVQSESGSTPPTTGPSADPAGGATTPGLSATTTAAGTAPQTRAATSQTTALLTGIRVASHDGFDRVVFEFAGADAAPGYDVRYVPRPVTEDASGTEVAVAGDAVVQIRMQHALDADLTQPTTPNTYTGPTRFSPGTPQLAEMVRTGGFENVLTWAAGVHGKVPFRVATLTDPPRLIVDFVGAPAPTQDPPAAHERSADGLPAPAPTEPSGGVSTGTATAGGVPAD